MSAQKTRTRYYPGFGTALEVQSQSSGGWFHMRWISGPCFAYQENLRKVIRKEATAV